MTGPGKYQISEKVVTVVEFTQKTTKRLFKRWLQPAANLFCVAVPALRTLIR